MRLGRNADPALTPGSATAPTMGNRGISFSETLQSVKPRPEMADGLRMLVKIVTLSL